MEKTSSRKVRKRFSFTESKSKDGRYCTTLHEDTSALLYKYCKATHKSRREYVDQCVHDRLINDYDEYIGLLTKEELVAMIKNGVF